MVLGLSLHMASKGNWIENVGVDAATADAVCRLLNAEQTHMIDSNIILSVADPFLADVFFSLRTQASSVIAASVDEFLVC